MVSISVRRMRVLVLVTGIAGVGAAVAAAGPAWAISRPCAWQLQGTANQTNIAYPDAGAAYWLSALPIPPGGHILIDGQFPHARYTSLITYNAQTQAIDGINDTQIQPDPGSTNPFLPGANRTSTRRSYTVQIVNQRIPASARAQNMLYTENADGSKSSKNENLAIFILRIYVHDRGTDIDGGVPLPGVSIVTSSGQKITLPDCPDLIPNTGLNETLAASGTALPIPLGNPSSSVPLAWHKYTNLATHAVNVFGAGTPIPAATASITDQALGTGGLWENVDNKYIYAQMDRTLGQVLVLHAKAPTTPRTIDGEPQMGTGQVRYWSICTNDSLSTRVFGCAHDELVPVDQDGYYTIAISTASARPSNATLACGIAWLPEGPLPRTELIMRNMLPSPDFKQAIQNVRPGFEPQDMGAYYPTGRYYATALDFERTGCAPPTPGSTRPAVRPNAKAHRHVSKRRHRRFGSHRSRRTKPARG
jgi:hypothetical protein